MDIDIVITWVDSNDPTWQHTYNQYAPADRQMDIDCSQERFRDWDSLRYWFRGIEQFAPWVRRIYLVTAGQTPEWLNTSHERLRLVNHTDFIPQQYLPTFSSHTIENNLHRIADLSEHFIYFNDDFYLTAPVSPERFFRHGLPTDMAVCNTIQSDGLLGHITLNNLDVINRHFRKHSVLRHLRHWFTPRYGAFLLRTIALLPWPRFSGFWEHHLPQPFRKTTLQEVWQAEPEQMHRTSLHRFRHGADVNQWLFRYWHLCKAEFAPMNVMRDSAVYLLNDQNFAEALATVRAGKKAIVVLNDGPVTDFEQKKQQLQEAFEAVLPHKSQFEK